MPLNLAYARALLFEVPKTAELAYCLMRDGRVPITRKLALGAALGLIVSPLDIPAWVPAIGDLDMLALGVLAVKVFVDACPGQVVEEHRAAIERDESVFDHDLQFVRGKALDGVHRLQPSRPARLEIVSGEVLGESEDQPS